MPRRRSKNRNPFHRCPLGTQLTLWSSQLNIPLSQADVATMGASLAPEIAACGIRGWKIWDKSEISRMLDAAGPVRNRYIAEIAPADILNRLHEYNPALSTRLNELFKTQIVNELRAEQWVRLSQFENADQAKLH